MDVRRQTNQALPSSMERKHSLTVGTHWIKPQEMSDGQRGISRDHHMPYPRRGLIPSSQVCRRGIATTNNDKADAYLYRMFGNTPNESISLSLGCRAV